MAEPVIDISDLATGPAPSEREAAPNPKRKPSPTPVAIVQFWDRWICECGAEYEAPRAGYYPAYIKRKLPHGGDRSYDYRPLLRAGDMPKGLPREVSSREERLPLCPWCAPTLDSAPDTDLLPQAEASSTEPGAPEGEPNDDTTPETISDLADEVGGDSHA